MYNWSYESAKSITRFDEKIGSSFPSTICSLSSDGPRPDMPLQDLKAALPTGRNKGDRNLGT